MKVSSVYKSFLCLGKATGSPSGCTAKPKGSDLFDWEGKINGPQDSPYEGGIFNLTIRYYIFLHVSLHTYASPFLPDGHSQPPVCMLTRGVAFTTLP